MADKVLRPKRKRQRKSTQVPEPCAAEDNGEGPSNRSPSSPRVTATKKGVACPFFKRDPENWATECGAWSSDIGKLFQHHIPMHRDLNDLLACDDIKWIEPDRFAQVNIWRRGGDKTVKLRADKVAEYWTNLYMVLFNIDEADRETGPSPYFDPELAVLTIEEQLSRHRHEHGFISTVSALAQEITFKTQEYLRVRKDIMMTWSSKIEDLKTKRDTQLSQHDRNHRRTVRDGLRRNLQDLLSAGSLGCSHDVDVRGTGGHVPHIPDNWQPPTQQDDEEPPITPDLAIPDAAVEQVVGQQMRNIDRLFEDEADLNDPFYQNFSF